MKTSFNKHQRNFKDYKTFSQYFMILERKIYAQWYTGNHISPLEQISDDKKFLV